MSYTVSLVLPVHNEADNIEAVVRGFYESIGRKIKLQIVVAEDGSTDGTKEILSRLSKEIPMTVLMNEERLGYTGGLKNGLQKAAGDYVLFCDSDGQHFPSDFFEMYKQSDGYDMVDGWRVNRADSAFRRAMSRTFQVFSRVFFGVKGLHDVTAPYRLVRRSIALQITGQVKYMRESFWTEFTIRALKKGAKIKEVPVRHRLRFSGETVVYKPTKLPKIVISQLKGMMKLWIEMR